MTAQVSVNLGGATPRRLLVDWANKQDAWVRQLTAETILFKRVPSDAQLDALYEVFLAEAGLSEIEIPTWPKLEAQEAEATKDDDLELVTLSNVESVNALASDQELNFDRSLTILFGQNGAGKTGYARVLKRISAVRSSGEILPNARIVHTDVPPPASATIAYRSGGEDRIAHWSNETGLTPFTRISVFDADAVLLHVDDQLGYVYTPAELALFGHVADGLREIQKRIGSEIESLNSEPKPLLSKFAPGTTVYSLLGNLGAETNLDDLEAAATVEGDADATYEKLAGEVDALRNNTRDQLLLSSQQTERELLNLSKVVEAAKGFDSARYEQAVKAVTEAEKRRAEAREHLFSAQELPGEPDEQWQQFVAAGEVYREHLGLDHYPKEDDACLYCMQTLSPAAISLITRYRTFLDETLMQQLKVAKASLTTEQLSISALDAIRAAEYVASRVSQDGAPDWVEKTKQVLSDVATTVGDTAAGQALSCPDLSNDAASVATDLGIELGVALERSAELAGSREDAASALAVKQQELLELSARIELKGILPTVRTYVRRAKRVQLLEKLSRAVSSGAARQLTVQSKLASEDLVNKDFEALFAEECARLNAPPVALQFQGKSGQAQRKKAVANHRPSAVLSEGEQKVLALADFLAESRMRETSAPLVFDDPVTSLDYRKLDEVAARIQHLSETHQVIVLTHNIMFASALISSRQNKKLRAKVYEVRDGGDRKGVLAPDVEPQLDTPADIAKRINVKVQDMPKAEARVQDALIKEAYDLLRAWCEAFVEQELLHGVTQRYRHNIMMTKLSKIDATRLSAATAVVEPLFARACDRMTGHSHAAEKMNTKPTVAEFQQDWEKAKNARRAYLDG